MADRVLSTVGLKCPRPLFETHKVMKTMDPGALLEVAADDPAFKLDIEAWCRRTGHELISMREESGRWIAEIRKS